MCITSAMASACHGILPRAMIWFLNSWEYLLYLITLFSNNTLEQVKRKTLFNKVAGFNAWNYITDSSTGIFLRILRNFSKNFIYRTPPDDCSCWLLGFNQVLFSYHTSFFPSFYPIITDNCNYGSLFGKGIKMKVFFHF